MKGADLCSFCRAVSSRYCDKVFLINFISTSSKLLSYFIFARFPLIEGYEQRALPKDLIATPFVEWFKTFTLRKSS